MESISSVEKAPATYFRGETIIYLILRLGLGGMLIFSSSQKFPMHTEFVNLVNAYHLIPVWMATIYATALPWVELLVGAYLVLGVLVRPVGIVSGLMWISFSVANISAIMRGDATCLHCFGQVIDLSPTAALTIDLVMLAIAVYLVIFEKRANKISFDGWFFKRQRAKNAAR